MTYIRYEKTRDMHRIRLKGHAGAAKKNEDIICAACSILCYTMAQNAIDMKKSGIVDRAKSEIHDGYAAIDISAIDKKHEAIVQVVIRGV